MPLPDSFKPYGLVQAAPLRFHRLRTTSEGGPGCGKTDFFLRTFPRPALAIELDLNDEGLRERYSGEDLYFKDVLVPPYIIHDKKQMLADFKIAEHVRDLYLEAVSGGYFKSVMIDEGAALYELARRSFLEDLSFGGEKQASYAPVNAYMKRFFTAAKQTRVNLYIPHRQEDDRKKGFNPDTGKATSTPTGLLRAAGWKNALYESQVHLVFSKDDKPPEGRPRLDRFRAQIKKCTVDESLEGMVLRGKSITLENLGTMIYQDTEGEWG